MEAIKIFHEKHGCLPLPGALPDMKAQSSVYVELQSLYKTKARKDSQEVFETARALPGSEHVDLTEVELFCKNARFVRLINATGSSHGLDETFGMCPASENLVT